MALMKWEDIYSVSVEEIDLQHLKLIKMINALHEAALDGQGKQIIGPILKGLASYTRVHFATEERLMAQAGYPELDKHRAEHAVFIRKVHAFSHSYLTGDANLPNEVMEFLRHWLINHIMNTDKKFSSCLAGSARV